MGAFTFETSYATRDDSYAALADAGGNMAVGDKSGQHDIQAVGVGNSGGSVSVAIDHASSERENDDERNATGVPFGCKRAPGVDPKSSIIGIEDDTKNTEGSRPVTGLDLHFRQARQSTERRNETKRFVRPARPVRDRKETVP